MRGAAAEDDVGMANGFDVAEKGVDAKGLKGVNAAVDGEADTVGAGAGAWDDWASEAAGAGAGAAAAAGFAKGFWNVNKGIAVAAGTRTGATAGAEAVTGAGAAAPNLNIVT